MTEPLVVLGEVRTCLLPSAAALTRAEAVDLLTLVPGRAVRWRERPGTLAVSPATLVGVDCELALGPRTARVVGTVATGILLAGGRIAQSSAHARVVRAAERRRQPWSHYLGRKGVLEVIGRLPERATAPTAFAEGFLAGEGGATILDLASIAERPLARIRSDARLDHDPPMRAGATRLRWAARVSGGAGPAVALRLHDDSTRSALLVLRHAAELEAAQRFCEDLAAHDWLLTVLAGILAEADRFTTRRERTDILAPALEHLAGLWMPGAHTPRAVRALWKELQTDPGFSRQWRTLLDRVRDGVAVATLEALRHRAFDPDW
ncbi:SCO2521 family protein [Nocardia blacklockiae]|uniref:SCO2521 family protein n=1 Tax=Nocardia blacklockiae TaxID=480036 RepID=UPI001894E08D|nr:SCO2521 family protein [Nocardia blacklockiae]MBF6174015.1 hypothetical protein [Nocardia blacklockiae]